MENTVITAKVICLSSTCGMGYYYSIIECTLSRLPLKKKKKKKKEKSFYLYNVFMDKYALNAL